MRDESKEVSRIRVKLCLLDWSRVEDRENRHCPV